VLYKAHLARIGVATTLIRRPGFGAKLYKLAVSGFDTSQLRERGAHVRFRAHQTAAKQDPNNGKAHPSHVG